MSDRSTSAAIRNRPVDKTAARVMSKGISWSGPESLDRVFDGPPEMRPVPKQIGLPDLTGQTIGRLRVVGLAAKTAKTANRGAKWVCRCTCGKYCLRSTGVLRRANYTSTMCSACDHFHAIRAGALRRCLRCGGWSTQEVCHRCAEVME